MTALTGNGIAEALNDKLAGLDLAGRLALVAELGGRAVFTTSLGIEDQVITAAIGTALGASSTTAATVGTYASLAATAAGAVMSYQGQRNQTAITKAAAKANAEQAEASANRELRRGEEQAEDLARQARALGGQQRSVMAARGLELNDGTPADLINQTDFFSLQDQGTVRRNAAESAYGMRAQAAGYRAGGNVNDAAAVGSLLSGSASVADKWFKYNGK